MLNYTTKITKFDLVNKAGQVQPFTPNTEQTRLLEGITGRDVILKSRQIGFSTLILAMFTIDFLLIENSRSVCISHDGESAQKLLDRVKFFLDSAQRKGLKLDLKYNSRSEMVNASKNSTFYIGKAGSKSFGRGDTLTNLHLSEFAFYPDAERLLASVLQAVVDKQTNPNSKVFVETTANGMNYFKKFWEMSKQGETGFTTHFFDNSHYSKEFLEQKRKELQDTFPQEYPSNDYECFLSTGRPFFNQQVLEWYKSNLVKPPKRMGYIRSNVTLVSDPHGFWKVWEEPIADEEYLMASDVGLTHDYSTACVLKRRSREVVATFRARLDPGEVALNLSLAGRWYNNALIAVERNGIGLSVQTALKEIYENLYTKTTVDKLTNEQTETLGWLTTSASRPLILGDLQTAIMDKDLMIYDQDYIGEMQQFVRNEKNGRPEALPGAHDDRVMALAILNRMSLEQPQDNGWDELVWQRENELEKQELLGKYM
jgi:hypothetical protein